MMNTLISKLVLTLLCVAALAPAGAAFADEYHYNNVLVGQRAAGLGGAYTALSDDPAGLFYNPAGIVYAQGQNLSGSANVFHGSIKRYKGVIGGNGWTRTSSSILPNFFGVIHSFGKGKLGLSYAVPDSILEDQDQVFANIPTCLAYNASGACTQPATMTQYVINFNNEDSTYNFGLSYALELSEGFSTGMTLYMHQRRHQWALNQTIDLSTGQYEWLNTYYENEEWGIRPVLGFMWSPRDKTAFGLSLSQTMLFDSNTERQETRKEIQYDGNTFVRNVVQSGAKRRYPLQAALGAAFFPSESLLFSGDITYYTETEDNVFGDREATWNAALGSEYYVAQSVALRAGLFTNRANTPEVKSNQTGQADHVDLYGASLSASYFTRGSSLTFGGVYSAGTGDAQVIGGSTAIQETTMQTWTLFLSAAYSY